MPTEEDRKTIAERLHHASMFSSTEYLEQFKQELIDAFGLSDRSDYCEIYDAIADYVYPEDALIEWRGLD